MDIREWLRNGEKEERFLIKDIATHGCSGAVNGIIYYYETTKFHAEHEQEIWDLAKLTHIIMKDWKYYYRKHLDATRPTWLSADVAYALAMKILDITTECTAPSEIPTFIHMKSRIQNFNNLILEIYLCRH